MTLSFYLNQTISKNQGRQEDLDRSGCQMSDNRGQMTEIRRQIKSLLIAPSVLPGIKHPETSNQRQET